MASKVFDVFLIGTEVDWGPKEQDGLLHAKRSETISFRNKGRSLTVQFPEGHPFEGFSESEKPTFTDEAGGMTKTAKVRDDERVVGKPFKCVVTLDGRTRRFGNDGVIIDK